MRNLWNCRHGQMQDEYRLAVETGAIMSANHIMSHLMQQVQLSMHCRVRG
jgi:hypothetical protein